MVASISVGSVSVDVVPSVSDFASRMRREMLPQATEIGREVGKRIQSGIEKEVKPVRVRVNMGQVVARLERLKKLLEEVDGRTANITVNVDMGGAVAEMRALYQMMQRLDGRRIDVNFNVQVAQAMAQIAAVNAAVRSVDNRKLIDIDVSTGSAMAGIGALRSALIGLGVVSAPAIAGIGAGLIGLVGPLGAAGAGFAGLAGVAIPSVMRIREALQAQQAAEKQGAQVAQQAQSQAMAAAGARQQLAAATRNAAYAHQQALDQVRQAETQLAQAQRSARQAQEDLNQARVDARRGLQDMASQVTGARLDERQTVFDLQDAEAELARLRADPAATDEQIARQRLVADQARHRLNEQRTLLQRLVQDEAAARKAGVEGSDQVRTARDRLADANQRVGESERALASARANVARVDQQSADQIAAARRSLTQATAGSSSAVNNLAFAVSELTPLERDLMEAWQGLTAAGREWAASLQPDVIPVLIKGITLLRNLLPTFTPLVRGAAGAIGELLDRASAAAQSPFWTQFAQFMGQSVGPAVLQLGTLAGSLLTAFAGIMQGFMPIGMAFLQVLNVVAERFAAFTTGLVNNPAFQSFVNQFAAAVPLIADTLSAVGSVVGSLFAALAPAMAPVLQFVRTLATTLAGVLRSVAPAIQSVFAALGPALSAVLAALAPVVVQLVNALAPLLVQLIQGLQPILISLVPVISSVITALAPVISALLSGLQPAIASLVPVVGLLVQAVGRILLALAPLLPVLGQFIAELVAGLMPILTPIVNAIAAVAAQIAGALIEALRQSLPALQQALIAVAGLLPALIPLLPIFADLLITILPLVPTLVQLAAVLITALVPVLRLAITIIVRYWQTIASLLLPVLRLLVSVVQWVASILMPVIQGIGWVIRGLGTVAMWLWNNAIKPAFNLIAKLARWLYSIIVVAVLGPIMIQFKAWATVAQWLWKSVIKPVFSAIGGFLRATWNNVIKPVLSAIWGFLRNTLGPAFRWIYNSIIRPVWNAAGSAIKWVWDNVIKKAFDAIRGAVGKLGAAFRVGVDAIKKAWDKLKDVAKKPVSFVVNTVFNKGIVGVWNAVANLVPGVKKLDPIRGFAEGGVYPGYTPGRDIGFIGVSGGEAIMRPEWTRAVGPGFVDAANAAARTGGVGGVSKFMSSMFGGNFFLGGVVDKFKSAAKGLFVDGLQRSAQRVFKPLLELADRTLGDTAFGRLAAAIPRALIGKMLAFFGPLEARLGGDGKRVVSVAEKYVGMSGNPNKWTRRMGLNGAPWCAMFVDGVFDEANAAKALAPVTGGRAAVWSYRALPKVSPDAKRPGDLALYRGDEGHINIYTGKGAVTIGGNESNSVRRRSGYINEASSIRRPRFAAGGIVDIRRVLDQDRQENTRSTTHPGTQILRGLTGLKTYDAGGWLPTGVSMVYNGTGAPEPVLTDAQWAKVSEAAAGGDGGTHFHAHMDGMTKASYESQIRTAFTAMQVAQAQRDRTGRRR